MEKWLNEIRFKGNLIDLEPLNLHHINGLQQAVQDGNLWELWYTSAPRVEDVEKYIVKAIQEFNYGVSLPF